MADFVYNIAKGRAAELANRAVAGTGGAKVRMLVLEAADTDAAHKDVDTVAALIALAATTEWASAQYGRKDVTTGLTSAVDDTNDRWNVDASDQSWTSVSGNPTTDVVFYYDPDGTDTDANNIPLTQHDWVITPDGTNVTINIADFYRAQ